MATAVFQKSEYAPPLNRWNNDYLSPGAVGSVGDPNVSIRLKHSYPDAPLRYAGFSSGKKEKEYGSNVQDGTFRSYFTGGLQPRLLDDKWNLNRKARTAIGWQFTNLKPDSGIEQQPIMGSLGTYSWHNQVGDIYRSRHAGDKFLPLPFGYGLLNLIIGLETGDIPRGGNQPGIITTVGAQNADINPEYSAFNNINESFFSKMGSQIYGVGSEPAGRGLTNTVRQEAAAGLTAVKPSGPSYKYGTWGNEESIARLLNERDKGPNNEGLGVAYANTGY